MDTIDPARRRAHALTALALSAACASACYSNSLLQEPRVLPPGKVRVGLGGQGYPGMGGGAPELGLRVGLFERTEARVKGTLTGADLGLNVLAHEDDLLRVLLMPTLKLYEGATTDADGDAIIDEDWHTHHDFRAASLPVIVAAQLGPVELFAGPDLQLGKRGSRRFGALAGHFGIAIPLGPNVTFIPELSVCWAFHGPRPIAYSNTGPADDYLARGDVAAQLGAGFTFGNRYAARR
jgi:hypothetical protein